MKQNFSIKRKFAFKTFTEEFFKNIFYVLSWSTKESTSILPYFAHWFKEDLVKSEFFDPLQLLNMVPVQKKEDPTDKPITGLLVYYHYYQKSLKR